MSDPAEEWEPLLTPSDPAPVEILNERSSHPVLLVCEHAGRAIPASLGGLGLEPDAIDRHIGWDIGAGAVARCMASLLGCCCVIQHYSRLVVDCNRPPNAGDSIPEHSDGTHIAANANLTHTDREARIDAIFKPYDKALADCLTRHPRRAAFSIHSFTPRLAGKSRPWDIGLLFRKDQRTSVALARLLKETEPGLVIGMNEPYSIDDLSDWFVPVHCEPMGLAHSLVEIRNDRISTIQGQETWAAMLAGVIDRLLQEI